MNIFGSGPTVDGKARSVLGDLSEDASLYEILRTVDQKAGEDVDPNDVVSKIRDLDDEVDTKLAVVDGGDVDQKALSQAAGTLSERSDLTHDGAMELLSAVARGDVDQAALTDISDPTDTDTDTDMGNDDSPENDGSGSDTNPDDTPDNGGGGVDQKQDDDGGDMSPLDIVEKMGDSDARDTVETYADSVNKDPQEAAAEWIAENVSGVTVEGYSSDDGASGGEPAGQPDTAGGGHDRDAPAAPDQGPDQMLEELNINERVADAVTSDEVLDQMSDALIQRMADNDEVADQLVQTVEQKGDFATTDDTVVTAPGNDSQTVGEAGAITGGNGNGGDTE